MINTQYRKLSGLHAGASYVVIARYSEIERPIRWMLHMEGNDDEKCIVADDDLTNPKLWEPLS